MSSPFFFSFLLHPLLSSLQYNNSNYVQTTKHASSNDSRDTGKLAHLHNNKCRFEPIENLLTFKWYKSVISKVCAYPGWLSVCMWGEWSNSQASVCALLSSLQHWQPRWQCIVIGEKMEAEKGKVWGGSEGARGCRSGWNGNRKGVWGRWSAVGWLEGNSRKGEGWNLRRTGAERNALKKQPCTKEISETAKPRKVHSDISRVHCTTFLL